MNTRKIIFRGKRVDNNEWIYGSLLDDCWFHGGKGEPKVYIIDFHIAHYECWEDLCYEKYEVIPESVGQYTGLKDKNNKEIYEGDLFEYKGVVIEVHWHNGGFMYGRQNEYGLYLYDGLASKIEIIGNIYETPQLIEEKTETA